MVLEERGGVEKEEGAASVQLVGRTQVLHAWGFPFSRERVSLFGQAEVPDLLPLWPG